MKEKNMIPSLKEIKQASEKIKSFAHVTPVLTSELLNKIIGCNLFFKCENFQKSGAFKFRGAVNALRNLNKPNNQPPVVTHSSGNHAGALAKASMLLNRKCIVVMPENAPKVKIAAVRSYGAEIVFCKSTLEARESTTDSIIQKSGAILIHPYNNFHIIAGQGTAALELYNQAPDLNCIITPVGGGGLLSGTSIGIKELTTNVKVFAGEPKGADDAFRSFKSGKLIPQTNPTTIADGLLTSLGDLTFKAISSFVDDIFTVEEKSIIEAMKLIWLYLKVIVEPSSAVPLAAIMENRAHFNGKNTGIILSGGNVDLSNLPFS